MPVCTGYPERSAGSGIVRSDEDLLEAPDANENLVSGHSLMTCAKWLFGLLYRAQLKGPSKVARNFCLFGVSWLLQNRHTFYSISICTGPEKIVCKM